MTELEKIVLARLIQQSEFISTDGLSVNLFSTEKPRRTYKAIKKLAANGGKIDEILLSNEAGIAVSELLEITECVHSIPAENFKLHVQKLREAVHHKEFFKETEKQRNFFLKGMPPDISKCAAILKDLKKEEIGKERPKTETLTEFLDRDIPKRQILIEPILGLQEMTMIHGRPKIGKSLLTLQLTRCLDTGKDWLGFKTNKIDRPILIIQVEIASVLMQERVKQVFGDIAGSEKIIIPLENRNIFFDQKSGRDHVSKLLEDIRPGLVILDPYSKFFTDEEMALKNPRPFFDFWQEQIEVYNLSLLFVHHDAKFQEGKLGGQKALGTTSINASTDGNWSLERVLDTGLDPIEFLKTARLSFESRNWQNTRPLDIRMNDNLTFELTALPKGSTSEWDLVEEIEKAGGQIEQKEVIKHYSNMRAFYQAKNKALKLDLIDEIQLKTKGNPVMLMTKNGGH